MKVFITSSLLCFSVVLFLLSGCSKDDNPYRTNEEVIESFLQQDYQNQVKTMDKEFEKYQGKTYSLTNITTYNEDGTIDSDGIFPGQCAYYKTITIMPKQGTDIYRFFKVDTMPGGENCFDNKDEIIMQYAQSGASDYKALVNFLDTNGNNGSAYFPGVLKLINGFANFFSILEGRVGDDGKFIVEKEYSYVEVE